MYSWEDWPAIGGTIENGRGKPSTRGGGVQCEAKMLFVAGEKRGEAGEEGCGEGRAAGLGVARGGTRTGGAEAGSNQGRNAQPPPAGEGAPRRGPSPAA